MPTWSREPTQSGNPSSCTRYTRISLTRPKLKCPGIPSKVSSPIATRSTVPGHRFEKDVFKGVFLWTLVFFFASLTGLTGKVQACFSKMNMKYRRNRLGVWRWKIWRWYQWFFFRPAFQIILELSIAEKVAPNQRGDLRWIQYGFA